MAKPQRSVDVRESGFGVGCRAEGSLVEQWQRVGAVSGVVAFVAFVTISGAPLTYAQGALVACVFGAALACASIGVYQVLRLHRRTVTGDLGVLANLAAALTVTLMLLAQLGMKQWLEMEFGDGATGSTERSLHAAFEAANGLQLGLDVAWDVLLGVGTVLLAVNMWRHPRFGRLLAAAGVGVAVPFLLLNLASFPEPPADADSVDLGPLIGLWYVVLSWRLARSRAWVLEVQRAARRPESRPLANEQELV